MDKQELDRAAEMERKQYYKAWRANNRDKTAEHRRRYWEKRALAKLEAAAGQAGGDANDAA